MLFRSISSYPCESHVAAKTLGWDRPALVYIDAEHDYESVVDDIESWLATSPLFIGGHDYGMESVRRAVRNCGLVPEVCGNVWWCGAGKAV